MKLQLRNLKSIFKRPSLGISPRVAGRLQSWREYDATAEPRVHDEQIEKTHLPLVPVVPDRPGIAFRFLGHFADFSRQDFGNVIFALSKHKNKWYEDAKNEKICRVVFPGNLNMIYCADPNIVWDVLVKNDAKLATPSAAIEGLKKIDEFNLIGADRTRHKSLRLIYKKAFARLDLDELPRSIAKICNNAFTDARKEKEKKIPLLDFFGAISFDLFHEFTYKHDFQTVAGKNKDVIEAAKIVGGYSGLYISFPKALHWLLDYNPFLTRRYRKSNALIKGFIKEFGQRQLERFKEEMNEGDILSVSKAKTMLDAFIIATHENRTDENIRDDELFRLLEGAMYGGFDTTSTSMAKLTGLLASEPEVQEKIYQEVKDVDLDNISFDDLMALKMVDNSVKESQRLIPIQLGSTRELAQDIEVGDFSMKKGNLFQADHDRMVRNPEFWNGQTDLTKFRPERWDDVNPPKAASHPFGLGPRNCVGKAIADPMLRGVLAYICKHFTIHEAEKPFELDFALTITVTSDSKVILKPRVQ